MPDVQQNVETQHTPWRNCYWQVTGPGVSTWGDGWSSSCWNTGWSDQTWSGAAEYWNSSNWSGHGSHWQHSWWNSTKWMTDDHTPWSNAVASIGAVQVEVEAEKSRHAFGCIVSPGEPNGPGRTVREAPSKLQSQDMPPTEFFSEASDKGARLPLPQGGHEAPAWMRNGPEYKIFDMDADGVHVSSGIVDEIQLKPHGNLPVHEVVADLEAIAQTMGKSPGRTFKDVTLDPKTRQCCEGLRAAVMDCQAIDRTLVSLLLRAVVALSKIRVLHQGVLDALAKADAERLQAIDASRIVDVLCAFATMNVVQHPILAHWMVTLTSGALRHLNLVQLSNLCWAAATIALEKHWPDLPIMISNFVVTLDIKNLPWGHLARIAWGLAKMMPSPQQVPNWAMRIKPAIENGKPKTGPMLSEAFWCLSHWSAVDSMQQLSFRCLDGALGRDSYALLLRASQHDHSTAAKLLRQMAKHLGPPGLKAAVMNGALMRLLHAKQYRESELLLQEMASQGLWTPVTYKIHDRFGGACALPVTGRPPAPGRKDPGQTAHKYTRAVYYAIERSVEDSPAQCLEQMEAFSQEKSWLKFGAEGKKGQVIDDVVRKLGKNAIVVEFGTFLSYSSIRIAHQLGPDCRIISVENDPEVACLAENMLFYTGMDDRVEVWVGNTEDVVADLRTALRGGAADMVYMDHNQGIYHEDIHRLEIAGIVNVGTIVVATQMLKPGAPLLAWHLTERQMHRHCTVEFVSSPDCGCPMMEDWVAIAKYHVSPHESEIDMRPAPESLRQLARVCNLMRWRTAQGLVDEKRWNCFVQHVRAGMQAAGIMSTKHVWEPAQLSKARQFRYIPLDY